MTHPEYDKFVKKHMKRVAALEEALANALIAIEYATPVMESHSGPTRLRDFTTICEELKKEKWVEQKEEVPAKR